ncbi:cleavage and polyadenylation specificity factor subunit 6-like [Diceros bicornis minor]|uniref:cleavage and polyadenylation specificity factor subunit 6-like n=1 Tax=Diceros bicornis minor TaxID=77932 RepID=UPI0026E9DE9F|nr:cleavage and polyadenylation specificity factor subunit 6-like [Diceros bicornis minor]
MIKDNQRKRDGVLARKPQEQARLKCLFAGSKGGRLKPPQEAPRPPLEGPAWGLALTLLGQCRDGIAPGPWPHLQPLCQPPRPPGPARQPTPRGGRVPCNPRSSSCGPLLRASPWSHPGAPGAAPNEPQVIWQPPRSPGGQSWTSPGSRAEAAAEARDRPAWFPRPRPKFLRFCTC